MDMGCPGLICPSHFHQVASQRLSFLEGWSSDQRPITGGFGEDVNPLVSSQIQQAKCLGLGWL